MEFKILEIEAKMKSKLNQIFSSLKQRRFQKEPVLEFEAACIEEEEEKEKEKPDVLTHFIQKQTNQLIDL